MADFDVSSYKPLYIKSAIECLTYLKTNISTFRSDIVVQKEFYRMFHTLKGQNLFMGHMALGNYCLILEKIIGQVIDKKTSLDDGLFGKLQLGISLIESDLRQIETDNKEIDLQESTAALEVYLAK